MNNESEVLRRLKEILKRDVETQITRQTLRELADKVLAGPLAFEESRTIVESLLAAAKFDPDPQRKHGEIRVKPRSIYIDLIVRNDKILADFTHPGLRKTMEARDSDPLFIADCIAAELGRKKAPLHIKEDHPGIHIHPKHDDEVWFTNKTEFDLDVHFRADRTRALPDPFEESPFEKTKLECPRTGSVSTGPAVARSGQRFFKYTVVLSGLDPDVEPGEEEHPSRLDPHLIDHPDERDNND